MERNTASQTLIVLAHTAATGVAKTGDAANLTAYVSIDGGAVTAIADTSAAELSATNAKGYYAFSLTQSETNGSVLVFTAKSSTSGVEVNAVPAVVQTSPGNFSVGSIDADGGYFHANVKAVAGDTNAAESLGVIALAEGITAFVAGTGSTTSVVVVTEPYTAELVGPYVGNLLVWQGQAREITDYANAGSSAQFTVSPPYTASPVATDSLLMILNRSVTASGAVVAGAGYVGDFADDDTIEVPFTTTYNGVLATPVGMTVVAIKDGNTVMASTGVTLSIDFGGTTGSHHVTVATSGVAAFAIGHDYRLIADQGTVGGVAIQGAVLGSFSIENRVTGAGGGGGGSTGPGDIPIDHDGGTGVTVDGDPAETDILRYVDGDGAGVPDLFIRAYLTSDYEADPPVRVALGTTTTGSDGRWAAPLMLDAGTYTLIADRSGDGFEPQVNTLVVP